MPAMLLALFAAAPLGAGERHEPHERPPVCAVEVQSDQAPQAWNRFRATRILDLEFEAELSPKPNRTRALQLRLYTPDGFLYQVLQTKPARQGEQRRFGARLPVAGTSIMASGLYGRWTVVPYLEGRQEPCGRGLSFVIRP